jgi:hypothetical protein
MQGEGCKERTASTLRLWVGVKMKVKGCKEKKPATARRGRVVEGTE